MDKEIFVGPCSKYINGKGWTTEIPVEMLKRKGYVKEEEFQKQLGELTERLDYFQKSSDYHEGNQKELEEMLICVNCFHAYVCEEYNLNRDMLRKKCAYHNDNFFDINQYGIKVRKETAEKFAEKIQDYLNDKVCEEFGDNACDVTYFTIDVDKVISDIFEIAKEITEG